MLGAGYIIEPESDAKRLRRKISLFTSVGITLPMAIYRLEGLLPCLIASTTASVLYGVWTKSECRGRPKWKGAFDPFPDSIVETFIRMAPLLRKQSVTYFRRPWWVGIWQRWHAYLKLAAKRGSRHGHEGCHWLSRECESGASTRQWSRW
jgi:hypothetical protein